MKALKKKYGIIFYDRKKNNQGLLDLEISAKEREKEWARYQRSLVQPTERGSYKGGEDKITDEFNVRLLGMFEKKYFFSI
mgnify:CR=1 FL=1